MKNEIKLKKSPRLLSIEDAKRIHGGTTVSTDTTTSKPVLKKKAPGKLGWSLEDGSIV